MSRSLTIRPGASDANHKVHSNLFIETALSYALSYIAAVDGPQIAPTTITILADNDYYSTPAALSAFTDDAGSLPRFHNFAVPISSAHKTGLGSSAALVTAFTGALLSYYMPRTSFDLATETGKRRLHNLAQAAHCSAQGKVGSGFDVASAVYGSCLYRRFTPTILSKQPSPGHASFGTRLRQLVDETGETGEWDTEIHKDEVRVPRGVRLVMCDVSCGSQTPGMVKQVLAWRQANPDEAGSIWEELQEANEGLAKEMTALASSDATAGFDMLSACFTRIRKGIRVMSEKSGVPIEPRSQTELLDACEAIPGVIGGVVPGAGGYDAISLLIRDDERTVLELTNLLGGWKFKGEADGIEIDGRVSMLGVREEMEGVRVERSNAYEQ